MWVEVVAYLAAAHDPDVHVQALVGDGTILNKVFRQRMENHHGGLGEEGRKETEALALHPLSWSVALLST